MRPIDSHLRTELRSEERRQYEQRRKDKEAELEAVRQQVCIKARAYIILGFSILSAISISLSSWMPKAYWHIQE